MKGRLGYATCVCLILMLSLLMSACGNSLQSASFSSSLPDDPIPLVKMEGYSERPAWSPDSTMLLFDFGSGLLPASLFRVSVPDGEPVEVVPYKNRAHIWHGTWRPQGDWIAFEEEWLPSDEANAAYVGGIFVIRPDGKELTRVTEVMATPFWSPDGEWIANSASAQFSITPGLQMESGLLFRAAMEGAVGSSSREARVGFILCESSDEAHSSKSHAGDGC